MKALVQIQWKPGEIDSRLLRGFVTQVLRETEKGLDEVHEVSGKLENREVSVLMTSDKEMCILNESWRKKPGTTDVLSFAMDEGEKMVCPPGTSLPLGDIVISLETASRQAAEAGHTLRVEVATLLVHGLLHLLGYDHGEGKKRINETTIFESIQERCVNHLRSHMVI